MMMTHILSDGTTLTTISGHGFRFSDGTECAGQHANVVSEFTLSREFVSMPAIAGHGCNMMSMKMSFIQIERLKEISNEVDIVVVPFPVLVSLREQGIRNEFPNVVAFNATSETQRSRPDEKIVDIENWSY